MLGINFTDEQIRGFLDLKPLRFVKPLVLSENQAVKQSGKTYFLSVNGVLRKFTDEGVGKTYYVKESFAVEKTESGEVIRYAGELTTADKWQNRAKMPERYARYTITITGAEITENEAGELQVEYSFELNKVHNGRDN